MTEEQNDQPMTPEAQRIAQLHDFVSQVTELITGYRKGLVDSGIGGDIADQMTLQFHQTVMAAFASQATQSAINRMRNQRRR